MDSTDSIPAALSPKPEATNQARDDLLGNADDVTSIRPEGKAAGVESDDAGEFLYFPKLAPELRRMIWKEACFEGRVVFVWKVSDRTFTLSGTTQPYYALDRFTYRTRWTLPAVLQVSYEARSVGLENYSLGFGTPPQIVDARPISTVYREDYPTAPLYNYGNPEEISVPAASPQTYINWKSDVLCPHMPKWSDNVVLDSLPQLGPISRLAVSTDWVFPNLAANSVELLSALDEIVIFTQPVKFAFALVKSLVPLQPLGKGRRLAGAWTEGTKASTPITQHFQSKLWKGKAMIEGCYATMAHTPKISFAWAKRTGCDHYTV